MATQLALYVLQSVVNAELAIALPGIETPFGWRQPPRQQRTTRRVAWVPGDEAGSLGTELGATKAAITVGANQTARNLADLDELFHVQIQAHDPDCPDDEAGQYTFTRLLYDSWRAAVHRATHSATRRVGVVQIKGARWVIDNTTEFRRGATISVTATIRCPIPDNAVAWAYPTVTEVAPATADLQAPTIEIPIPPTA
jgi:hypothetical protein